MPLRDSVQTLRIEGRGLCTNRDRSDGHAGKGAHERPRCCNWLIQAQVQLSDEWPGLGVNTYADRFDRGQNRGGNGVLWRAQGRGANFRCNAMAIGGGETAVGMDQGATKKDRDRERQGKGKGMLKEDDVSMDCGGRLESSHHFCDCAALTPCYLRSQICSLCVSSTIADWQSEFLS